MIRSMLAWLGIVLIAVGAWWIYPPAGLIAPGLLIFLDASRRSPVEGEISDERSGKTA